MEKVVMKFVNAGTDNFAYFHYFDENEEMWLLPVGIAKWNEKEKTFCYQFVREESFEIVANCHEGECKFIDLIDSKIKYWIDNGLPYMKEDIKPYETDWWLHVQKLLIHRIRLTEILISE